MCVIYRSICSDTHGIRIHSIFMHMVMPYVYGINMYMIQDVYMSTLLVITFAFLYILVSKLYSKPPELLTPSPPVVQAVQGESVIIKAVYKGDIKDPNLLAYWCVTTLDGNHRCIRPADNDSVYNVTTDSSLATILDYTHQFFFSYYNFTLAIEIKSLTLDLSQANLTSTAVWRQNSASFNSSNSTLGMNVLL